MKNFKHILLMLTVLFATQSIIGCGSGETDYSLADLQLLTSEKNTTVDVDGDTLFTALDTIADKYALDTTDNTILIDLDLDDEIEYALTTTDSPFVLVDGVLAFKETTTPSLGAYPITIIAEDAYGSKVEKSIIINVVVDKNFLSPIILSTSFAIHENSSDALQVETLVLGNGKLSLFSFVGGADDAMFTISAAGILTIKEAVDYENAAAAHSYEVKVQVEDDLGNLSNIQSIVINIIDIDEGYTFTSQMAFTVLSGSTYVGKITAVANDSSIPDAEYSFTTANVEFAIGLSSGEVRFNRVPIYDEAGENNYTFEVLAQNQYNGSVSKSQIITVEVVADYSTMLPVIVGYENSVTTIPTQNVIIHVAADPADPNGEISFSVQGDDAEFFNVDENGNVHFIAVEDFYSPGDLDADNVFDISILVTDNYGNSVETNTIHITQIEDPAKIKPVITTTEVGILENTLGYEPISFIKPGSGEITEYIIINGSEFTFDNGFLHFTSMKPDFETKQNYSVDVQLKDKFGNLSEVKSILVVIVDVDEQYNFTSQSYFAPTEGEQNVGVIKAVTKVISDAIAVYSLVEDTDSKFNINSTTGEVTFKVPTSFTDTSSTYTFKVGVKSQYNGSYTVSPEITVQVAPIARTITFTPQEVATVPEQMLPSPVVQISAVSSDSSANITYAMQAGTDTMIFSITPAGAMTIKVPEYIWSSDPDENVYRGAVVASDQYGNQKVQQGEMHVTTAVDGKPYFVSSATQNVFENIRTVTTLQASSHIFPSPLLSYSIVGGNDSTLFSISSTGIVSFKDFANFELKSSYDLIVEVTDNIGHPDSTIQQAMTINVIDVSDKPTAFIFENGTTSATVDDGYHTFIIISNDRTSYISLAATASPSNGTLAYALTGSYDTSLFSIVNGQLKVVAPPRSSDKTYALNIRVSEDKGEFLDQIFYLTIRNK